MTIHFSGSFGFRAQDIQIAQEVLADLPPEAPRPRQSGLTIVFPTDEFDSQYAKILRALDVNLDNVTYQSSDGAKNGQASRFFRAVRS